MGASQPRQLFLFGVKFLLGDDAAIQQVSKFFQCVGGRYLLDSLNIGVRIFDFVFVKDLSYICVNSFYILIAAAYENIPLQKGIRLTSFGVWRLFTEMTLDAFSCVMDTN